MSLFLKDYNTLLLGIVEKTTTMSGHYNVYHFLTKIILKLKSSFRVFKRMTIFDKKVLQKICDFRPLNGHDFDINVLVYKRRFLVFKKSAILPKAKLWKNIVKSPLRVFYKKHDSLKNIKKHTILGPQL